MSYGGLHAEFIDGARGKLLVVSRHPTVSVRGTALLVPPFAEEMNKTRPMLAELSLALAEAGVASVLPDLYGTGDSGGEFSEARWDLWLDDLRRTALWADRRGWRIDRLLGVRLGAPLAAEFARSCDYHMLRTVLWQPVLDGERFLTQFLRLRVAASMMAGPEKETAAGLRARLRAGEVLEIAGYELAPGLADQIEGARLEPALGAHLGQVLWIELVRDSLAEFPAAAQAVLRGVLARGLSIEQRAVAGEPYWSSTEIVRVPAIVAATAAALTRAS